MISTLISWLQSMTRFWTRKARTLFDRFIISAWMIYPDAKIFKLNIEFCFNVFTLFSLFISEVFNFSLLRHRCAILVTFWDDDISPYNSWFQPVSSDQFQINYSKANWAVRQHSCSWCIFPLNQPCWKTRKSAQSRLPTHRLSRGFSIIFNSFRIFQLLVIRHSQRLHKYSRNRCFF